MAQGLRAGQAWLRFYVLVRHGSGFTCWAGMTQGQGVRARQATRQDRSYCSMCACQKTLVMLAEPTTQYYCTTHVITVLSTTILHV